VVAILGGRYAKEFWAADGQMLKPPEMKTQLAPEEPPDATGLALISANGADPAHFIEGDFRIVKRRRDITMGCWGIFESSFRNYWSGSAVPAGQVLFADPGEDFEFGDVIRGGLPLRRLVLAGLGTKTCFIYTDRGGAMYAASCLAVMDYTLGKPIWVGKFYRGARNIKQLRLMFSKKWFQDSGNLTC